MKIKLRIAGDFNLPSEAITETFAILGIRGSGKTNTGVVVPNMSPAIHPAVGQGWIFVPDAGTRLMA